MGAYIDNYSEMSSPKHYKFPAPPLSLAFGIPEGCWEDLACEINHSPNTQPKVLQREWDAWPTVANFSTSITYFTSMYEIHWSLVMYWKILEWGIDLKTDWQA